MFSLSCFLLVLVCAFARIPPGAKIISATPELQDALREAELAAAVARAAASTRRAGEDLQPSVTVAQVNQGLLSHHLPTPHRAHVVSTNVRGPNHFSDDLR